MFSRPAPGLRTTARRRVLAVLAASALALGASACGGDDDGDRTTGAAKQGGSITVPLPVEPRGLDPFSSSYTGTADSSRMAALYDFLVWLDPKTGEVKPRIAESLKPDATGAVWTLRIRPGVTFTDGTAYDAAAVKANWDANNDPAMASLHRAYVVGVTSEVVGPLELRITLAKPSMNFDRTVASGLAYIASPTAFKADPRAFSGKPVGAGPFMLKEWVRGDHQTFVRNPGYWQAGLPKLDQVTFKTVADNQQIINSMASGQADLTVTSDGQAAVNAKARNLKADVLKVDGGQYFLMNLRRPPFDDVRARRALAMALDADAMMKTVFNGQVGPGRGVFRENSPLVDRSVRQQPSYDQAEAQRLFDELAAEGRPVTFTFLTQQHTTARATAEYMQSRLNQYRHVRMEIEALEIGAYITKGLVNRDFQAQNFGMWLADPDPQFDFLFRSTSPQNYGGFAGPAADRALDDARAAGTPQARRAAYTELVKVIADQVPLFVWQEATTSVIHRPGLTNVTFVNDGAVVMDQVALTG